VSYTGVVQVTQVQDPTLHPSIVADLDRAVRARAPSAKGGVVYLTTGDMLNGFALERTKLQSPPATSPPK
jgi:hypothetical protein